MKIKKISFQHFGEKALFIDLDNKRLRRPIKQFQCGWATAINSLQSYMELSVIEWKAVAQLISVFHFFQGKKRVLIYFIWISNSRFYKEFDF